MLTMWNKLFYGSWLTLIHGNCGSLLRRLLIHHVTWTWLVCIECIKLPFATLIIYNHLCSPETVEIMKKEKNHKKQTTFFTKYPDQTSHTAETTDKNNYCLFVVQAVLLGFRSKTLTDIRKQYLYWLILATNSASDLSIFISLVQNSFIKKLI